MKFFDVITSRRSVRAFTDEPVTDELLNRILETVNEAPSAGNLQAYRVFIVREKGQREGLGYASWHQSFVAQAPVSLVFCATPSLSSSRYGERGSELYAIQDATIACTYAMLAATALGLGTVWVGAFDPGRVRDAIQLEEGLLPVAILPIGRASEDPNKPERRPLGETIVEA